jgi:hypothetical protein
MENKIHSTTRRWSREEEISLLKGFQIFGNKWHMVKLYFLPYKTRNEIRLRSTSPPHSLPPSSASLSPLPSSLAPSGGSISSSSGRRRR